MKRVIIDTDPGIDDAAAIFLALASPELEVVALTTTFGNASVEACTANARRVLALAGRSDIPVFMGAGKPLLRPANEGGPRTSTAATGWVESWRAVVRQAHHQRT